MLTLVHEAKDEIKAMIANVKKGLDAIRATAPPLPKPQRWIALVRYIVANIMAEKRKNHPTNDLCPALATIVPTG